MYSDTNCLQFAGMISQGPALLFSTEFTQLLQKADLEKEWVVFMEEEEVAGRRRRKSRNEMVGKMGVLHIGVSDDELKVILFGCDFAKLDCIYTIKRYKLQ